MPFEASDRVIQEDGDKGSASVVSENMHRRGGGERRSFMYEQAFSSSRPRRRGAALSFAGYKGATRKIWVFLFFYTTKNKPNNKRKDS